MDFRHGILIDIRHKRVTVTWDMHVAITVLPLTVSITADILFCLPRGTFLGLMLFLLSISVQESTPNNALMLVIVKERLGQGLGLRDESYDATSCGTPCPMLLFFSSVYFYPHSGHEKLQ